MKLLRRIGLYAGLTIAALTFIYPFLWMVSSTFKDLVAGSEIQFADRGIAALKGIPGEWRLFSVS